MYQRSLFTSSSPLSLRSYHFEFTTSLPVIVLDFSEEIGFLRLSELT